jgi:hypothetical protein
MTNFLILATHGGGQGRARDAVMNAPRKQPGRHEAGAEAGQGASISASGKRFVP